MDGFDGLTGRNGRDGEQGEKGDRGQDGTAFSFTFSLYTLLISNNYYMYMKCF